MMDPLVVTKILFEGVANSLTKGRDLGLGASAEDAARDVRRLAEAALEAWAGNESGGFSLGFLEPLVNLSPPKSWVFVSKLDKEVDILKASLLAYEFACLPQDLQRAGTETGPAFGGPSTVMVLHLLTDQLNMTCSVGAKAEAEIVKHVA